MPRACASRNHCCVDHLTLNIFDSSCTKSSFVGTSRASAIRTCGSSCHECYSVSCGASDTGSLVRGPSDWYRNGSLFRRHILYMLMTLSARSGGTGRVTRRSYAEAPHTASLTMQHKRVIATLLQVGPPARSLSDSPAIKE